MVMELVIEFKNQFGVSVKIDFNAIETRNEVHDEDWQCGKKLENKWMWKCCAGGRSGEESKSLDYFGDWRELLRAVLLYIFL